MRILIYSPPSNRAVDQQSVMQLLISMGHDVYFLSQVPEGDLHKNAASLGVRTFSADMKKNIGISAYFRNTRFLIRFIKKHQIEFVFAHLQGAGLAAGIARYFTGFKLAYVRHNTDEHKLALNRNAILVNKLANMLAPKIIAISGIVERYLINVEKINPKKLVRINLGYNFTEYLKTDRIGNAEEIRREFPARMLIISVARLIPVKRHLLMFEVIKELLKEQLDIKLVCLSNGSFREPLQDYINTNNLENNIFLVGTKRNVLDYFEAGDIFLHLSGTEASNNAAKEAGYCYRPSIVCKGVGDFEDYIENEISGYLVAKDDPVEQSVSILKELYNHPGKLKEMGQNIRRKVIDEFDIQNVKVLYEELLTK
jgi:glycosyltransferase involved in cell wall biosynthesis